MHICVFPFVWHLKEKTAETSHGIVWKLKAAFDQNHKAEVVHPRLAAPFSLGKL